MKTTTQRIRSWNGPALLSFGFRPFFLFGAIWAALAMLIWLPMVMGRIAPPPALSPVDWHAHAMLFGYGGAAVAGFVLTAVPNWTGRLPVTGWPLAGLAGMWLLGRIVTTLPLPLPPLLIAVVDLSVYAALMFVLLREVIAGKNWRNLPVVGLIGLFVAGLVVFHVQARGGAAAQGWGLRLALAALVMLMALIGGRIIPSFTRNWLVKRGETALPAPMDQIDKAALVVGAVALVAFVVAPDARLTAVACGLAGAVHLLRLSRWRGLATTAEPLLWILHLAYAWVAAGFLSVAAAGVDLMLPAGAQHVWMAGGVGILTLAVMSRASLGHTGRALTATRGLTVVYVLANLAAALRLAYALAPGQMWMLHAAGTAWIAAFGGFAVLYWPILTGPRIAARQPSGGQIQQPG
ncbi:MAG: NnrS family protein [Paracoccus sp. (in: a-proteobacteria)]|uniref:NnrS family protein n=1 Tax=Paracoccus sp. TaxID=267 RepID=UPI0026E0F3F5|nr:NnrS family protein [Paracoccus sp. (in: a-proteobacteria)]MDO5614428.1 NnrS family protein [Paracoccus sp. (in: a-proteobacteria)]